jgi:hypothetical protein
MANIGLERIINKFDGTNFQTWKTKMFFKRKTHWEYVDRSNIIPITLINQHKWDLEDVKAKVDILLCMKDNKLIHLKTLGTPKEIWDKLINRFQTTNVVVKNSL